MEKISCSKPLEQYLSHQAEINSAVTRVLTNGNYILGAEVNNFEKSFSKYLGINHTIGVGSGTDALFLTLRAYNIGLGDEVITVSHSALATVAAIIMSQAKPVLIDVDPRFYTIDVNSIEKAITPKTKAIIPVHLYGQPADMNPILSIAKKYNLKVIEDCAQAHGALYEGHRVGTIGDAGCFSFYPTKNLGGIGDGGAIVTSNINLMNEIRCLRQYGWNENRISKAVGVVSRLDELQAGILNVKLQYLDRDNSKRIAIANIYRKELEGLSFVQPMVAKNVSHVYHLYVVSCEDRENLQSYLLSKNIEVGIHYSMAIHQQPGYKSRVNVPYDLPHTEKIVNSILSLPMYPELKLENVNYIIQTIKDYYLQ